MDWGLAKVLPRGGVADDADGRQARRQRDGHRHGPERLGRATCRRPARCWARPAYMAPEQARGEIDRVDERADVFALGSILCEILTGQPAFTGRTSGEILRKAARGDLADALARLDACGADAELIALARDCLAAEPEDRPRDAGAVAERITAYLAGVQERLRRGRAGRAPRRGRRRRAERRSPRRPVGLAARSWLGRRRLRLGPAAAGRAAGADGPRRRRGPGRRRPAPRARPRPARPATRRRGPRPCRRPSGPRACWRRARPTPPLRDRVAALLAGLDREQAEAASRPRRSRSTAPCWPTSSRSAATAPSTDDPKRTDADYAAAFREAGLDLDATGRRPRPARGSRPRSGAGGSWPACLDDWAAVRRRAPARPEAGWRRLVDGGPRGRPRPVARRACAPRLGEPTTPRRSPSSAGLADDAAARRPSRPASLVLLAVRSGTAPATGERPRRCCAGPRRATRATSGSTTTWPASWSDSATAEPSPTRGGGPAPDGGGGRSARERSGPRSLGHRPAGPGEARRGDRRVPRGDPAQARRRRGPRQPRHRPEATRGSSTRPIAEYREAIRLKPDDAAAHNNLGNALQRPGEARRGDRRIPRGDPAQARRRRGPLQPRHRPAGPGEARRGDRRVPRGDPAQARRRRGPLQPRQRPERPGEAGRGDRRVPRGDPAQARRRRGPQQPRPRPRGPGQAGRGDRRIREAIRLKPDYAGPTTTSALP